MCFSLDLFNVFIEMILSGLEVLARFIIGRHNLNNINYAEYTVLMVDSQRKLKELLDKIIKLSKMKVLTVNCKEAKLMLPSKGK